jgi:hypothetical protein
MALLQVTKAYGMTSTEALQIIAGVMPIDLLTEIRARLYRKREATPKEEACRQLSKRPFRCDMSTGKPRRKAGQLLNTSTIQKKG